MDRGDDEDARPEPASQEHARAIWQTVLLAQDEHDRRELRTKMTRKRLVRRIVELMRRVRREQ
jgi:hypothetical protein